ncbi:hypothetical protein DPEC_G00176200 [Dallia pectoralis]|uniref:Uncharacterized protein n=1 Tax=Dallia pectoralis TaxID=75939 RepID=A0ACC2GF05_DALPE|nr:hypothetical protein DPEC_G00176200 [Dallia pectoralis]
MPVIVLEPRDLFSSLSLARMCAILFGCLTFSLVASMEESKLSPLHQMLSFRILCMFTWCLFFALTLLIHVVNVIQFHSLVPISWKNLTVSVAALAALMTLSATLSFPWAVAGHGSVQPCAVAATVSSCLTFAAYVAEAYLIRTQAQDERGYMASVPGLLKVLQLWGGCEMVVLVVEQVQSYLREPVEDTTAMLWVSGTIYVVCLLMSLATVVVVLGDCAGRCPVPFDRLLVCFSLTGVLFYMVATILCFARVLGGRQQGKSPTEEMKMTWAVVVMETVVASITLLAYTVDLAFSFKLLRDRSQA